MKKYITYLICCFLAVGLIPQIVNAGDQNNPEVTDPENDVVLFGQYISPIANRLLKHLDVLSSWFYENSDEPDILYVILKLQDVKKIRLMGGYGIGWLHDGVDYIALTFFKHGKENLSGIQISGSNFFPLDDFYTIDEEKNTITWAIPKDAIGGLTPGDTLNSPIALTAIRFCSDSLANLVKKRFGTNLIAFDLSEVTKNYVILY